MKHPHAEFLKAIAENDLECVEWRAVERNDPRINLPLDEALDKATATIRQAVTDSALAVSVTAETSEVSHE